MASLSTEPVFRSQVPFTCGAPDRAVVANHSSTANEARVNCVLAEASLVFEGIASVHLTMKLFQLVTSILGGKHIDKSTDLPN